MLEISGSISYSEAEKLYRYIIQADRSGLQNASWGYFENILRLTLVLEDMTQSEASYNLCTYIIGRLKQTFGEGHYRIREFQSTLGGLLCAWGRLPESIKLFYEIITEEDINQHPFREYICHQLAHTLREDGNYRKAIV
ncbi:bdbfdd97-77e8-410b-85f1-6767333b0f31 [Sclerotinia trifoliorum]|uniref:Bdbfdd97-77e8-410b-85f1-6767333b0f31 n=1 Tax=Sclerotinia trifoliorum TaxID=28548 RepID=A0A8H2ZSF0_9HELO|nr:bdbfdd97-77e8-410b-85f1-6767333b0f31 [Sclerotinia trifoliorum]